MRRVRVGFLLSCLDGVLWGDAACRSIRRRRARGAASFIIAYPRLSQNPLVTPNGAIP